MGHQCSLKTAVPFIPHNGERRALNATRLTAALASGCQPKYRFVHAPSRFVFYLRSLAAGVMQALDMTHVKQGGMA